MSITKPKTPTTVDAFIGGAPDAHDTTLRGAQGGRKLQISLTIAPELLSDVDVLAKKLGISRAATINLALRRIVERGIDIDPVSKQEDEDGRKEWAK
jgi:hypothetical protein